tara:strand:- start:190 stop:1959 length:1770 start_codon:yes stop_codon:yes gene_type:complete
MQQALKNTAMSNSFATHTGSLHGSAVTLHPDVARRISTAAAMPKCVQSTACDAGDAGLFCDALDVDAPGSDYLKSAVRKVKSKTADANEQLAKVKAFLQLKLAEAKKEANAKAEAEAEALAKAEAEEEAKQRVVRLQMAKEEAEAEANEKVAQVLAQYRLELAEKNAKALAKAMEAAEAEANEEALAKATEEAKKEAKAVEKEDAAEIVEYAAAEAEARTHNVADVLKLLHPQFISVTPERDGPEDEARYTVLLVLDGDKRSDSSVADQVLQELVVGLDVSSDEDSFNRNLQDLEFFLDLETPHVESLRSCMSKCSDKLNDPKIAEGSKSHLLPKIGTLLQKLSSKIPDGRKLIEFQNDLMKKLTDRFDSCKSHMDTLSEKNTLPRDLKEKLSHLKTLVHCKMGSGCAKMQQHVNKVKTSISDCITSAPASALSTLKEMFIAITGADSLLKEIVNGAGIYLRTQIDKRTELIKQLTTKAAAHTKPNEQEEEEAWCEVAKQVFKTTLLKLELCLVACNNTGGRPVEQFKLVSTLLAEMQKYTDGISGFPPHPPWGTSAKDCLCFCSDVIDTPVKFQIDQVNNSALNGLYT